MCGKPAQILDERSVKLGRVVPMEAAESSQTMAFNISPNCIIKKDQRLNKFVFQA